MQEIQDRAKAYSFELQANQSVGVLRIGWKRFNVSVTQYSWSGYTIVVWPAVARRLTAGRNGILEFQGSSYKVSCSNSQSLEDGTVAVHLELDATESTPVRNSKKKRGAAASSISLNQRDPVLGTASWICLLMLLMILPGWGEGWGTSAYLSEGFRSVFVSVCDACKCVLSR